MHLTLFGGSFNPPHLGHAIIIQDFLASGLTDQIWLLPAHSHTFGKDLAPSHHRLEMADLLIDFLLATSTSSHVSLNPLKLCPVEIDFQLSGHTIDTLEILTSNHEYLRENLSLDYYDLRRGEYSFLMGSDQLPQFHRWGRWQELLQKMIFYVYPRAGHPMEPLHPGMKPFVHSTQTITNFSSTLVRNRLTKNQDVSLLVPPTIIRYIKTNHLYQEDL